MKRDIHSSRPFWCVCFRRWAEECAPPPPDARPSMRKPISSVAVFGGIIFGSPSCGSLFSCGMANGGEDIFLSPTMYDDTPEEKAKKNMLWGECANTCKTERAEGTGEPANTTCKTEGATTFNYIFFDDVRFPPVTPRPTRRTGGKPVRKRRVVAPGERTPTLKRVRLKGQNMYTCPRRDPDQCLFFAEGQAERQAEGNA